MRSISLALCLLAMEGANSAMAQAHTDIEKIWSQLSKDICGGVVQPGVNYAFSTSPTASSYVVYFTVNTENCNLKKGSFRSTCEKILEGGFVCSAPMPVPVVHVVPK